MKLTCSRSTLKGAVDVPGSKSHTIRAVAIAALADGESTIRRPLESHDAQSSVKAYTALGASIQQTPEVWKVSGFGGAPQVPADVIDVGNSGTSLNMALGTASLLTSGMAIFTGDEQIRRRPAGPLMDALNALGARLQAARGNGCPPIVVRGTMRGGTATVKGINSQYVSSLLVNAPLAENDTRLTVEDLHERPYVQMTLDWLRRQGIQITHDEAMSVFEIPGGQHYTGFDRRIPADFSSATFFLAAGALGDNAVLVRGLDMNDTQGDRAVVDYLQKMGAAVTEVPEGIHVQANDLHGADFDLNATPDALPMMAVLGCFAKGTTRLLNVPQARIKETDRIAVMRRELERLGGKVEELADGLVLHESRLRGADVDGHGDHRVVMALAVAGTQLEGVTTIHGSEAVAVTYPGFADAMTQLGAQLEMH
jgi:3-phosphoshikimate 1-carboxyvinyltransferase